MLGGWSGRRGWLSGGPTCGDARDAGDGSASQADSTALSWASWRGHVDIVLLLLDRGATVNRGGFVSQTACLAAVQGSCVSLTLFKAVFLSPKGLLSSRNEPHSQHPSLARAAELAGHPSVLAREKVPGAAPRLRAPSAVAPTPLPRHLGSRSRQAERLRPLQDSDALRTEALHLRW